MTVLRLTQRLFDSFDCLVSLMVSVMCSDGAAPPGILPHLATTDLRLTCRVQGQVQGWVQR